LIGINHDPISGSAAAQVAVMASFTLRGKGFAQQLTDRLGMENLNSKVISEKSEAA